MNARQIKHLNKKLRQYKRDKKRALQRATKIMELTGDTRHADYYEKVADHWQLHIKGIEVELEKGQHR